MQKISKGKIRIKNLLGIIENPSIEDLLFEIVYFLEKENRLDEEFIKHEVNLKTRCRINSSLDEDLKSLVSLGFLEHMGWTKYRIIRHPW